jgi:2,3-bisphosphoglycerate-dependent phosphoglycerate mutase
VSSAWPRRRLLGLALALAGATALGCGESCACNGPMPEAAELTVYVIRHAEKQVVDAVAPMAMGDVADDPPLSSAGQMRAMGLAEDLPVRELDAIYVTKTKRSYDTASAVIALTGLEPIYYPPRDVDGLVERVRKRYGERVLVVGHSNTIPPLLQGLGVQEPVEIADDQYGDLWIVTVNASGTTLEVRRFGESVERFDPGR